MNSTSLGKVCADPGTLAAPGSQDAELELHDPAERFRVLVEFNGATADYPSVCIHDLVTQQAARTPDAVAVVCAERHLTYAELDARSNQLAHRLRALDVGPDVIVGLCVARSPEMIVGLLGILKAGGAYLPLDPAYPEERLAVMLRQADVPVLLTQADLLDRLPPHASALVLLDDDTDLLAQEPRTPPVTACAPGNLAYVIYTSGSTGAPKGIEIEHRGVVNYLTSLVRQESLTSADVFLNITSLSFDPSVRDIFTPLSIGARLVLLPPEFAADPAFIASEIRRRQVTTIVSVIPSFLEVIAGYLKVDGGVSALRHILTCGEPLTPPVARRIKAALPGVILTNQYGASENTMSTTAYAVPSEVIGEHIPVGRPIQNTRVYVMNPSMRLCPIGIAGEVYVAGPGVARGYLNQPDLTAERFLPDPFAPEGTRMYRTGDIGRWRSDGQLELLGRIDHQVKIRGFRVELVEIEAAILADPAIARAVVVARQDAAGELCLVGYVAPKVPPASPQASADILAQIRARLARKLPSYMTPSQFAILEALPLTPNGKVDRDALPPVDASPSATPPCEIESTSTEATLTGIWATVLGVDRIGPFDNFFEVGGNSLTAARVMAQVRDHLQADAPIHALFECPTIKALGQWLDKDRTARSPAADGELEYEEGFI